MSNFNSQKKAKTYPEIELRNRSLEKGKVIATLDIRVRGQRGRRFAFRFDVFRFVMET